MIPEKRVQDAILAMGGNQRRECYQVLYMSVYEGMKQQPRTPQMKEIWMEVKQKMGKEKATAVSKALERAVADLWENGNREELGSYQRSWQYEAPYPRDFIRVMARYVWEGEGTVERERIT